MVQYKKYFKIIAEFPKSLIVFLADLFFTLLAVAVVVSINSERGVITFANSSQFFSEMITILLVLAIAYRAFGLYRGVWRFASLPDLIRIIKACFTGTLILAIGNIFLNPTHIPKSSLPLFCVFAIFLLSGARLTYRWAKDNGNGFNTGKKVLIIGAGTAGEAILRELNRKANQDFYPVGLIDDDTAKRGLEIHGIRVLGTTRELNSIVQMKNVELILIAIPRATTAQMRRIVNACEQTNVTYRTLPSLNDIASGKTNVSNIRNVSLEDLLCRETIQFDRAPLSACIYNKKILVTGAGGSIGSELCRKLAEITPASLILVEASEYNLFKIQAELHELFPALTVHSYLVSITHHDMINEIMAAHTPDYVFHAAAYKHVPLLEPLPRLAIENNIFGTQIVAEAALANHVKKFILVSTDKAVNPENVMGATKRCAELLCQSLNNQTKTHFVSVRFGNVLGSTGSVIPIFREQIAKNGPVTVTHPDMERYFMTISEAASLIIQTVTLQGPSDLFVLDMGEPIKIQYLAEQMIKLSGHIPNVDIKIKYSGLRPGEKINEELFYSDENVMRLNDSKILRVEAPVMDFTHFSQHLIRLKIACQGNDVRLKDYLFELAKTKYFATSNTETDVRNENLFSEPQLAVEYS
ncbi:MAG: nucleoside-diphosphate sugar epimerase/dehydratase [Pseudomonadota bacterium]